MGMQVGGKGPQADINVTPLVDIVLVLLIIFMVITPLLSKQLPIEVPQKAEIDEPPAETKDQLFIKLFEDGRVELNKTEITLEELETTLTDKLGAISNPKERVVFFDGEDYAPYGNAVAVMDIAKGAGAETIGMITPKDLEDPIPGVPGAEGAAPAPAPE